MKKPMPKKPGGMPPISDSVASGNRMSKENAKDMKAVKKTAAYRRGGKVKKYAEGGMMGAGLELEAAARRGEMERELGRQDFSTPKVSAPDKKQSFSEAFAAARKRGDKTFKWNGGTYGTKMKGEDSKPAPKAASKSADTPKPTEASKSAAKTSRPGAGERLRSTLSKNLGDGARKLEKVVKAPFKMPDASTKKPGPQTERMAAARAEQRRNREMTRKGATYAKGGKAKKRYV